MVAKLTPPRSRKTYLDCLNILAILAVLFLHHDFGVHHFNTGRSWFFDLALKIVMYFCIPVFLMCTGTTLLGYRKKYSTKVFFKKRLTKILIPMLAWFMIMTIVRQFILKDISVPTESPISFMNFFLSQGALDYYWYLFLIIGVYLVIPILSPLAENKHKHLLVYSIVAIFIISMVLPNLSELFGFYYNGFLLHTSAWLIYPLIGYYISTYNLKPRTRAILYSSAVISLAYQFITTTLLSYNSGEAVLITQGYTQFTTAIYSSAVFCFIRNIKIKIFNNPRPQFLLRLLASCSFGVYLCHYLILRAEGFFLRKIGISDVSWVYRFICPFLTYALCVLLVLVLKKIPFLRRIVP